MIFFKPGVMYDPNVANIEVYQEIFGAANIVYADVGWDVTVTSLCDGEHMEESKHYLGEAVDLRTRFLTDLEKDQVATRLQVLLGPDYDVVLEDTHLHIEYDLT